ncbi:flagellar hook-basal body complex protein FliE [Dyella tabacisoli]|uniref:Flagellar hook-basal body complex protein FliE n=1 Tax=Dyella tabacisoli TaxID=2282381 RepID=A0A369UKY5_9GAMM|nr:flagellar hook-basal body complex protein FliE [Dyella tabacisoli]RDD81424.1 flagellar hook-basal body complex protein FliE [Dyella tabacisoli]
MSVAPLEAISIGRIGQLPEGPVESAKVGTSFMQMIGSGINEINGSLTHADAMARALAAGQNVPVHDVMIAMEQAHLKLQLAVQVRNRVVDAYQNLTNMQM